MRSLVVASEAWWKSLTKKQQEAYIKLHPNSKYASGVKVQKSENNLPKKSESKGVQLAPKNTGTIVKYDRSRGKLQVPDGMLVRLTGLGSFHKGDKDPLAELVPERKTHSFALHPDGWKETFYSLTLKEPKKIAYYKPTAIEKRKGILVGDMAIANQFYRSKDEAEKKRLAKQYKASLKLLEEADLSKYKLPELLLPPKN